MSNKKMYYNNFKTDTMLTEALNMQYSLKSPLRYPGGKTRGVEVITNYFPKDIDELVSPFFGGGSIELYLTSRNIVIYGYDIFQPLVEFWQCLIERPEELANKVKEHYPLTKQKFYHLQSMESKCEDKMEAGAIYYVLNRSSFSGATFSGGMSPGHPRFTESSIGRIREFYNPNIKIEQSDFKETLRKHENMFAYLDPPYLIKSLLYGKKGNAHRAFDHKALANILMKRERWILSYNDCDEIRELYKGCNLIQPSWKYGMSNDKLSKEILILSEDLS